jgi:hypothetical protein
MELCAEYQPVTIVTQNQTASGQLTEIEQTIAQTIGVWTGVNGATLLPATFAPLTRTSTQNACGSDGLSTICFDQADMAFTPGVLAFTRVITTDRLGVQVGSSPVATQVGQILDADIYFNPSGSNLTFATPQALPTSPSSYDLESLLTHEVGHFLVFSIRRCGARLCFRLRRLRGQLAAFGPRRSSPTRRLAMTTARASACSIPIQRMHFMSAPSSAESRQQTRWRFPRIH